MFGRKKKAQKAADDALYRAVSRKSDPSKGDAAGMVAAAEQALGSKKAVAERLGVSERSVQRWASGDGKPRWGNAKNLKDFVRNDPSMRKQQLSRYRESRIRNQGGTLKASGEMGVSASGKKYRRPRDIEVELSGEAMGAIMDKWLLGDDEGAMEALHEALDSEYVSGFELGTTLEDLDFLR